MAKAKPQPAETVATWPLAKIKPYERNPRTHPESQIELLAQLMVKHGIDQPIVVDERGVIIKGHGRRLAALHAGMKTFPVVVRRGLAVADKRAMRIADNQVGLLSGWDHELIRLELQDLVLAKYDLPLLGFDADELMVFQAPGPDAPGQFPEFDENVPVEHTCPKCGYQWSGKASHARAGEDEDAAVVEDQGAARPKRRAGQSRS
jgi:ParB/Sulfiredoxin domain